MSDIGPILNSPAQFTAVLQDEVAKFGRIVAATGAKAE